MSKKEDYSVDEKGPAKLLIPLELTAVHLGHVWSIV